MEFDYLGGGLITLKMGFEYLGGWSTLEMGFEYLGEGV